MSVRFFFGSPFEVFLSYSNAVQLSKPCALYCFIQWNGSSSLDRTFCVKSFLTEEHGVKYLWRLSESEGPMTGGWYADITQRNTANLAIEKENCETAVY